MKSLYPTFIMAALLVQPVLNMAQGCDANPGTSPGTAIICGNETGSLLTLLDGNPDPGGTWTTSTGATVNNTNIASAAPGTYTYTVEGTGGCTASVSLTLSYEQIGQTYFIQYCGVDPLDLSGINPWIPSTYQISGVLTNPLGNMVPGMVDPSTSQSGLYTYTYIDGNGCVKFALTQLQLGSFEVENTGPYYLSICQNDSPFALHELLGMATTQDGVSGAGLSNIAGFGQWLHNYIGSPNPGFVNFYSNSNYTVYPANLTQNSLFTYAVGVSPCASIFIDVYVDVYPADETITESVVACLPYVWEGNVYTNAGSYSLQVNTGAECSSTLILNLEEINAGVISASTNQVCTGGVSAAPFSASLTGANGPGSFWYLSPQGSTAITAISPTGPAFDWNLLAPGNYNLHHVAYTGDFAAYNVSSSTLFTGCHDVSAPSIIEVSNISAGLIGTTDNTLVCLNSGPAFVNASQTGGNGAYGTWVLTDQALNIIGLANNTSEFNLSVLSQGDYRIYYAASPYPNPMLGAGNLNNGGSCVAVSNFIAVAVTECFGGVVLHNFENVDELNSNPNPVFITSYVDFTTATSQRVQLEVYDASGRLVQALFNADAQAGMNYRFEFDASALPTGVYIYRLTSETGVTTRKFLVSK